MKILFSTWQNFSGIISCFLICMLSAPLFAQIKLEPDGSGQTYELIENQFGRNCYEVPDCGHPDFGRHITEVFDENLNKYVFVFHVHASIDDDRCRVFDRQRNEIKGADYSPDDLKHVRGERVYARWKFKLDAGFVPSSRFTHLMQIKPFDGDADLPIITLTARAGNPEKMEVIHSAGQATGSLGKIEAVNLAPFKGEWVEAIMEFKNEEGSAGKFSITIKRVSDEATLLSVSKNGIDLWRTGTTYNRLKWGIYRGLSEVLRDEQIRFADFCISETKDKCSQTHNSIQENTDIVLDSKSDEQEKQSDEVIRTYPNPTSGTLTVDYTISEASSVTLTIASINEDNPALLVDKFLTPGVYQYILQVDQLPSGVHLIKLKSNGKLYVHKFIKR